VSDPGAGPNAAPKPKGGSTKKRNLLAEQELRLLSTLVLLLGIGLFLALPFVLSIGSVVFLPLTTAVILSVLLAPLADRLSAWGVPNTLASVLSSDASIEVRQATALGLGRANLDAEQRARLAERMRINLEG